MPDHDNPLAHLTNSPGYAISADGTITTPDGSPVGAVSPETAAVLADNLVHHRLPIAGEDGPPQLGPDPSATNARELWAALQWMEPDTREAWLDNLLAAARVGLGSTMQPMARWRVVGDDGVTVLAETQHWPELAELTPQGTLQRLWRATALTEWRNA